MKPSIGVASKRGVAMRPSVKNEGCDPPPEAFYPKDATISQIRDHILTGLVSVLQMEICG